MRKSEIVRLGLELGAPLDLTWSCYSREDAPAAFVTAACCACGPFADAGAQTRFLTRRWRRELKAAPARKPVWEINVQ